MLHSKGRCRRGLTEVYLEKGSSSSSFRSYCHKSEHAHSRTGSRRGCNWAWWQSYFFKPRPVFRVLRLGRHQRSKRGYCACEWHLLCNFGRPYSPHRLQAHQIFLPQILCVLFAHGAVFRKRGLLFVEPSHTLFHFRCSRAKRQRCYPAYPARSARPSVSCNRFNPHLGHSVSTGIHRAFDCSL